MISPTQKHLFELNIFIAQNWNIFSQNEADIVFTKFRSRAVKKLKASDPLSKFYLVLKTTLIMSAFSGGTQATSVSKLKS
ncbi:MAG: hypothetical protein AAGE96_02400 [Cyanobacteria bacterium P01_G01_bin.19]